MKLLLEREGIRMNHKKLRRLYAEERLQVLLNTSNGRTHKTAARRRTGRPVDHLMNANSLPSPGMPGIGNGYLFASRSTVGLVAWSSTIVTACTQQLAI